MNSWMEKSIEARKVNATIHYGTTIHHVLCVIDLGKS